MQHARQWVNCQRQNADRFIIRMVEESRIAELSPPCAQIFSGNLPLSLHPAWQLLGTRAAAAPPAAAVARLAAVAAGAAVKWFVVA